MADWGKLAMVHIVVGYEANVLGTIRSGGGSDVQGLLITGFVLYTIAVLLLVLQEAGESNKIVGILLMLCVLIAGILIIVGMAIWGSSMSEYVGTVNGTAAAFAILGAIFLLIGIVGGGKTGPS